MAHWRYEKTIPYIKWDWQDLYDDHELTFQDKLKLCVIEANKMYRDGLEESPLKDSAYDYMMDKITDDAFKEAVGTSLGDGWEPDLIRDCTLCGYKYSDLKKCKCNERGLR